MKSVRFRLRPLAPWATPWHADSFFGAICWELLRLGGDNALSRTLQKFRQGPPPFVLSDAFPADTLPRPLCAAGGLVEQDGDGPVYVTREQFGAIRHGEAPQGDLPRRHWWMTVRRMHATVPRLGQDPVPFQTVDFDWRPEVPEDERFFSLYARAEEEWVERLRALLSSIGRSGFGKRSSLGRGSFEVMGPAEHCDWLEPLPFENAFVSLSHFVPDDSDPADGWWHTLVKYPRMGSERSASSAPYKGRLVMLTPGSCFRPAGRPRRWYGRMLTGLSPAFPDVVHYALAYAVGVRWDAHH